jgi:hypothetical protein
MVILLAVVIPVQFDTNSKNWHEPNDALSGQNSFFPAVRSAGCAFLVSGGQGKWAKSVTLECFWLIRPQINIFRLVSCLARWFFELGKSFSLDGKSFSHAGKSFSCSSL